MMMFIWRFPSVQMRGQKKRGADPAVRSEPDRAQNLYASDSRLESQTRDVAFHLPAGARALADAAKTAAAHILINRAGPALRPGPRRYNRSWNRDGASMGAAMLRMGHATPICDFMC